MRRTNPDSLRSAKVTFNLNNSTFTLFLLRCIPMQYNIIAVCLGVLLVFQNQLAIYKMSHVDLDQNNRVGNSIIIKVNVGKQTKLG